MRVLGELAVGTAHDLGNILDALRLRVQVAAAERGCSPAYRAHLSAIEAAIADGAALLTGLTQLARDDPPATTAVPLDEVVRRTLELAASSLRLGATRGGKRLRIVTRLAPVPAVRGQRGELCHALLNLLLNARDAMPAGGTVVISTARAGDGRVLLRIDDEGVGIRKEDLPRIFDPLFTTKGAAGLGMGLAMVRRTMERVGGAVSAANRPGGGASFTLSFVPFHQRPAQTRSARRGLEGRRAR